MKPPVTSSSLTCETHLQLFAVVGVKRVRPGRDVGAARTVHLQLQTQVCLCGGKKERPGS